MRLVTVSETHQYHPSRQGVATMLWRDKEWMVRFLPIHNEPHMQADSIKRKLLSCDAFSMGSCHLFKESELVF